MEAGALDDFKAFRQIVMRCPRTSVCSRWLLHGPISSPMAWPTMNAAASASVSRTVAVVMVRRSALCKSSCPTSWMKLDKFLRLRLAGK